MVVTMNTLQSCKSDRTCLIFALSFALSCIHFANAQTNLEVAEQYFYDKYIETGCVEWTDYQARFCAFMRPRDHLHLSTSLFEGGPLELVTHSSLVIQCDILKCGYARSARHDIIEVPYARGPHGAYYPLRRSESSFSWYNIKERLWIPDESYEEELYYHFERHGCIKFDTREPGFCRNRLPSNARRYVDYTNAYVDVVIVYKFDAIISVQLVHCEYELPDGSEFIASYAEGPSRYYEMRLWNFIEDVEWWAIYDKSTT